jgi:multidrug transporter EmrE-like cation transporter
MSFINFLIISCSVILNAIAQLFLKKGAQNIDLSQGAIALFQNLILNFYIWSGFTCYGLSIFIWIIALSRVDVSTAYPMLAMGFIFNAIAAWYIFGEPLGAYKLGGMALIISGMFLIAKS